MESTQLVAGEMYAFREGTGEDLVRVILVERLNRRGKLRIRFDEGPLCGLVDFATSRQIVAPWHERELLLRDEERSAALRAHAETVSDRALAAAVAAALDSAGEPSIHVREAATSMPRGEFERLCSRAGIPRHPTSLHHLAFQDRHGLVHLPPDGAVRLAESFAQAEPTTVTGFIEDQELELRARGSVPGDRWWRAYLREKAPGFALARQWAGAQRGADALAEELLRLRALVSGVARDLADRGDARAAQRLLRALDGG